MTAQPTRRAGARRNLQAVAEGDRSARRKAQGVAVARRKPAEPDWRAFFGDEPDPLLVESAAATWREIVPLLHAAGLLSGPLDVDTTADYCIAVARLAQCEREISDRGLIVPGQRGMVRNPATTIAAQYRHQMVRLSDRLGLSPGARAGLKRPDDADDGDDPWSS